MEKDKISRQQDMKDCRRINIKHKKSWLQNIKKQIDPQDLQSPSEQKLTKKQQKYFGKNKRNAVTYNELNDFFKQQDIIQLNSTQPACPIKSKSSSKKEIDQQRVRSLNNWFKNIFNGFRMQSIQIHFINILRRNSIFRKPIIYQPFSNQQSHEANIIKGIQVGKITLNIMFFISIVQIFVACFLATLLLAFKSKIKNYSQLFYFETFSIFVILAQILSGLVRVKDQGQRKIVILKQISKSYIYTSFMVDLACFLCLIIAICVPDCSILIGVFFLKIPDCIQKFNKIQIKMFYSFYWQQYLSLMKILLTNFLYAHLIAILLLMMSWLDQQHSWLNTKNILYSPWYEQYSWAIYWATTIMLTVGFGDISAGNYKQAICLIIVQTMSCLALAYNINCIGNIMKDLKASQLQKNKDLKILKKLYQKNQFSSDLSFKLSNHVKQTYDVEKKFNFDEQKKFIQKLPLNLKHDFLRAANFKNLVCLYFIKNFTHKTIMTIAQNIETKISHPEQIILSANNITKLVIVKQGEVGLFPDKSYYQKYSKMLIDKIIVNQHDSLKIISLDFLQVKTRKYDIKSITYSQIYQIQIQQLLNILKRKDVDIQFYFSMKDKQKINLQNLQMIKCQYCKTNHSKFRCTKLHFIPIAQQLIFKHLHNIKTSKNDKRIPFIRFKSIVKPLSKLKQYKNYINSQSFKDDYYLNSDEQNTLLLPTPHQISSSQYKGQRDHNTTQQNILTVNKQQLKSYKNIFSATQYINKQLKQFFYHQNKDFWQVESDIAKDFKFYFSKNNAKNLQNLQFRKSLIMRTKTNHSVKNRIANIFNKSL